MKANAAKEKDGIQRSLALARKQKPAYAEIYPLLEALFLIQASTKGALEISPFHISPELVQTKWNSGFPLLLRWDFPVDVSSAESILTHMGKHIPEANQSLGKAHGALTHALSTNPTNKGEVWQVFLGLGEESWEKRIGLNDIDLESLVFLGRSCVRPSIEWIAEDLLSRFPLPDTWLKGYCPVCGSLPALLYTEGEGERKAYCSWCATKWRLHRFQCPSCENRYHESIGYLVVETEPLYRIQYCRLCKAYYKVIDIREMLDPPYFLLEEWTTLHLDLLAQREGWEQPGSLSRAVYGDEERNR